ncbi:MAG: tyrosine-type recombinase/integrase [Bacillota bacterium]|uniref:tyrosine-type recombinase/integrase n=1 Tax=Virgibacillus salarius TaxID=447199 RepID=UPI0031DFD0E6
MEMANLWKGFKDVNGQEVFLLFSDEYGIPHRPDTLTQFWNRFVNKHENELRRVRFHDLRHSSASLILSEGVNVKVVQKRLGHKNIQTTLNLYSHITEEDDKKASDIFDKFM